MNILASYIKEEFNIKHSFFTRYIQGQAVKIAIFEQFKLLPPLIVSAKKESKLLTTFHVFVHLELSIE